MSDHIEDFLDGMDMGAEAGATHGWGENPPETVFEAGFDLEAFHRRLAHGYVIKDKRSAALLRFGPLLLRRAPQRKLLNRILAALKKGGPVRIGVLKSRKQGVSTVTDVLMAELAMQIPGWNSTIIAHTADTALELFSSLRTAVERMTHANQCPEVRVNNVSEIKFGVNSKDRRQAGERGLEGSQIRCESAGAKYALSGQTPNALHLSEAAKFDAVGGDLEQERFILSALGAVPKVGPSLVVVETTANGQQGWFYRMWMAAMADKLDEDGSSWIPVFIPWFHDPDCRAPVPPGYQWDRWPAEDIAREKELVRKYKLTADQLFFRRRTLRTDFGMNADYWDQEYPDSWETAFIATGAGVMGRATMERLRSSVTEPVHHADTFHTTAGVEVKAVPGGAVRVWEEPVAGAEYVLGADVADGVTFGTDVTGRRKTDSSTFSIWRRSAADMVQVAECISQADNMEFGRACAVWGKRYNNALVNVERNRAHAVIAGLRVEEYPVHRLFRPPMSAAVSEGLQTSYFFNKTQSNSKVLMDTLRSWCVDRLVVRSAILVHEFGTLRQDSDGRIETNGKDVTIAASMAVIADAMDALDIEATPGALAKPKPDAMDWARDTELDDPEKPADSASYDTDTYGGGWFQ